MECPGCGHLNREGARFCDECGGAIEQLAPAPAVASLPASVGEGRYRVQRLLGEGARKVVYAATDARLGRDVAVAVIKTDDLDDAGRHRIEREARAMARLGDHPNIVTVFDVGDDDGQPYIVSELMPGGSVAEALSKAEFQRMESDEALRIGEQVALALAHAHEHGVVHRDLKPANVWLAADGTARLGDFGLAVETDRSRITSEGMVVGTVAYLAPEQAVGRAPDARSDLYALGASLYEMLTGRPPFLGDDAVTVISQHLNTAPIAPSWHNEAVAAPVEALVLALLAKDPGARPVDAPTVVAELGRLRALRSVVVDDAPVAATSGPPVGAGAFGRFVGRAAELDSLKGMFDEALSGNARLVMVAGEPGIGKTRLVEELGVYAAVRAAQVWWGHCYEGELGAPYLPFVEALRTYVRGRSDDELRAELSTGAPEVATIVSELRTRFPDLPISPALEGDAERLRLFEGVAAFLTNASTTRPIVLMLDDVHWADKPTLLLLQYLARNLRRDRVLIVCTYRDVELDRTHPLAEMIAALRREHLYERVLLRGLDRDEVKSFIEAVGQQETPDQFAETIFRETEGNPFFVAEILRHLGESGALQRVDGRWVAGDGTGEGLPEGVREVIGRRLSLLGDECNRMLTIGAAMPGGFSLEVAARVLDVEEDAVLDLLDEALNRQIIRERRDQAGVYEFNHALIRQTLYSELSTPRRVRLHRQILAAIEELYAPNPDPHLTELAYHAFQAAPGGDVAKAVDYARRAGQRAAASAAHEEAARSYDLALQALELDDSADELLRAELLLALGDAYHHAAEPGGARDALLAAADLGRRLDDPVVIARAALVLSSLRFTSSGSDPEMLELLEEAVARREEVDDSRRAQLLARLGNHIAFVDAPRHAALADEAMEAARRSGDPTAIALAHASHSYLHWGDQSSEELTRLREEMSRYADASGNIDLRTSATNSLFIDAMYLGDRNRLDEAIARYTRLTDESRSPYLRYVLASSHGCVATLEGRYDDTERFAGEAITLARRTQDRVNISSVGVVLFPMMREQGRAAEMETPTRRAVEAFPLLASWQAGLAHILAEQGKFDEAAAHLDELAKADFAVVGDDVLRLYALAALGEVACMVDDRVVAARIFELVLPRAEFSVVLGNTAYHGAVERYLGLLDRTLGRPSEAVTRHEAALAIHERMRARPWAARSQYDLAGVLLDRGETGDHHRALGLFNDALDTANSLGMNRLVEQVLTAKLSLQGVASGSITASIDIVAAGVSIERPDLRQHAASDGTVTVLFSDIEGYTMMNERLGDARTQVLLRSHDALVRDAVAAHGGTVVKSAGDGYMIVFRDASEALACAVAMQRAHDAHDFGSEVGRIRVRIGVHAGEVIHEGDDFFGRTVIVAARIADMAQGGEILVSDALRGVQSAEFADGREVTLKGIRGPQTVHPVRW